MLLNLPDLWQEPLESSSRIVEPMLFDDGSFQDVFDVLAQMVACAIAPVPMGKDDGAEIRDGDRVDGLVADRRERVLLEATAPVGLSGLPVPALAAHLGSDLVDTTKGGSGLHSGVTAGTSNPAVLERDAARVGERDKVERAQAKIVTVALDNETLHPLACARGAHVQIQALAIGMTTRARPAHNECSQPVVRMLPASRHDQTLPWQLQERDTAHGILDEDGA